MNRIHPNMYPGEGETSAYFSIQLPPEEDQNHQFVVGSRGYAGEPDMHMAEEYARELAEKYQNMSLDTLKSRLVNQENSLTLSSSVTGKTLTIVDAFEHQFTLGDECSELTIEWDQEALDKMIPRFFTPEEQESIFVEFFVNTHEQEHHFDTNVNLLRANEEGIGEAFSEQIEEELIDFADRIVRNLQDSGYFDDDSDYAADLLVQEHIDNKFEP